MRIELVPPQPPPEVQITVSEQELRWLLTLAGYARETAPVIRQSHPMWESNAVEWLAGPFADSLRSFIATELRK